VADPIAYDVVIVGAGAAGCALANRLSADPTRSVALLEAGGDDDREAIRIPRQYFSLWGTDVDWGHVSTPQPGTMGRTHSAARPGPRRHQQPQRDGLPARRRVGLRRLGRRRLLRLGMGQRPRGVSGTGAWLRPAVLAEHNPLSEAMVEAAVEAGFPRNPDFDSGTLDGAGWNKSTIAEGARVNAHRAFVAPVRDRPNLHVLPNVRVLGLAMDGTTARGVVVQEGGGTDRNDRRRRDDPLRRSVRFAAAPVAVGDRPGSAPEALGIAPVADLPVGENLIDHLLIGIVYNSRRPISDLNAYCTEGCAFARSTPDRADCDIEISFAKEPHFAPDPGDGVPRFTIIPGITRPKSRGTVRLTAADPDAPLAIDPNYFSHPDDMATMIRPSASAARSATRRPFRTGAPASTSRAGDRDRRGDRPLRRARRQHLVPPRRHLPDGRRPRRRRRPLAARLRRHRPPRRRRLDHARHRLRQHQAASTMIGWRAGDFVLG
jgi:choline dehydrogenase